MMKINATATFNLSHKDVDFFERKFRELEAIQLKGCGLIQIAKIMNYETKNTPEIEYCSSLPENSTLPRGCKKKILNQWQRLRIAHNNSGIN